MLATRCRSRGKGDQLCTLDAEGEVAGDIRKALAPNGIPGVFSSAFRRHVTPARSDIALMRARRLGLNPRINSLTHSYVYKPRILGGFDMKLVVGLSPADKAQIDGLVTQGRYASLDQFIGVAVRNQIALENDDAMPDQPVRPSITSSRSAIPEVFQRTSGFPEGVAGDAAAISDRPLPHFATKLFPCKAIVRFLAHEITLRGISELPVTDAMSSLDKSTVTLRDSLRAINDVKPRPRGTQFHTGLPEKDSKSLLRFQTYYYQGRPGSPGPSQSIPVRLGFINIRESPRTGEYAVGITSQGASFSSLANPILDGPSPGDADLPFSPDEISMLWRTLKERAPADAALMAHFIGQLGDRTIARDDLVSATQKAIRNAAPQATASVLSGLFVATTSRLVELGAVEIVKDGARSSYRAGPLCVLESEAAA